MSNITKFIVYKDRSGKTRWRLVAGNGETVATSQGYSTKRAALAGVSRIKEIVSKSTVVDEVEFVSNKA